MERNVGAISPADRRFYRQTRVFCTNSRSTDKFMKKWGGAGVSLSVGKKVQSEVQKQDSVN